jgi:hypothetical protein
VLGRFEDPENPSKSVTIRALKNGSKRSFYLELLKFYLLINNLTSIIIIIDDIDSIKDSELLAEFVHLSAKSWDCLQNNASHVFVKLLVSERPETYRNLFINAPWFTAFGFQEEPINLTTPPNLADIFKKRFDFITDQDTTPEIKNQEEWNIAYNVVMDICHDLAIKNQDILLNLCNLNVRKSFDILLELLTYGFWLQKDEMIQPYFQLRRGQFRKPSNILIIKAIGYKNNDFYINGSTQIISNVLHYKRNSPYLLLALKIVRIFIVENELNEERFTILEKSELIKKLCNIIPPSINHPLEDTINNTIEYLLKKRLLLVSAIDNNTESKLYLSPKGEAIWKLMGENSVLLEMFRDDMWLDESKNISKSIRLLPPEEKFPEILNLSNQLINEETKIISNLKQIDGLASYRELFGDILVSTHIAEGVIESVRRYYQSAGIDRPTIVNEPMINLLSKKNQLLKDYLG